MILFGSYASGFAPRDGQPLYPELLRGCVGAWAPCLGPSGLTLRDWSGYSNHGTVTNGPTWNPVNGRQSLSFDGVNDRVIIANSTPLNFGWDDKFTLSAWIRTTQSVGSYKAVLTKGDGGVVGDISFVVQSGQASIFLVKTWAAQRITVRSTTSVNDGKWRHIAATYDGSRLASGTKVYVDGVDESVTVVDNLTGDFKNSSALAFADGTNWAWYNGAIADVLIHNRCLSPSVIRLLATRPGIAYEMAPRRRASSGVAFNRRRRLLVGA